LALPRSTTALDAGGNMLVRTKEELAAAKTELLEEYSKLPDRSNFGDDNRATEKRLRKTFEELERIYLLDQYDVGDALDRLLDGLYDLCDISSALDYICSPSIHVVYWAMGEEDELS